MSIALVLGPHFKLLSVDFTFKRMYSAEEVGTRNEKVIGTLKSLYEKYLNEYIASKVTASTSNPIVSNLVSRKMMRKDDNFYVYLKSVGVENPPKSDLKVYLGEPIYMVEDESSFDVLK
jgi:hypothetical protein